MIKTVAKLALSGQRRIWAHGQDYLIPNPRAKQPPFDVTVRGGQITMIRKNTAIDVSRGGGAPL
jgi:hypothetical protein